MNLSPENWITNYSDEMYRYTLSKTSDHSLSEDLVQEAFLGALNSLENFKGESSEKTWLYSILKFKIADYYRKSSTKNELSNTLSNNDYSDYFFDEYGEWNEQTAPCEWSIDACSALENKELGAILTNCIEKLPKTQRQLINLKLVEEEETEKVCKEMQLSSNNFWTTIHRAKLVLRDCLEKNWLVA